MPTQSIPGNSQRVRTGAVIIMRLRRKMAISKRNPKRKKPAVTKAGIAIMPLNPGKSLM